MKVFKKFKLRKPRFTKKKLIPLFLLITLAISFFILSPGQALASFPQVGSVTDSVFSEDTTDHNVYMPSEVKDGDLLIVFFANDGNATVTTPSGWTQLWSTANSSNTRGSGYAKRANGAEGNTAVNFITSANERATAQVYKIPKGTWQDTGTLSDSVTAGTGATASSTSPNPPSLTTGWGTQDVLWIATYTTDAGRTMNSVPTSFSNGTLSTAGTTTTGVSMGTAIRQLTQSVLDPSTFSISGSSVAWSAQTVAIRGVQLSFHNADGSTQIAFNNIHHNSTTPTFRVSAVHSGSFNRISLELNTEPDFSGTSHTQIFSGSYSSGTEYNILADNLTPALPPPDNTTYYARIQISSNGGSTWSQWSTQTWTYIHMNKIAPSWRQAFDLPFATGTFTGNTTSQNNSVTLVENPTGLVATGGTITNSGGYIIHTFTSSGTFQITSGGGEIQYLVVGGGGGGGRGTATPTSGGGGGAGGVLTGTFNGSLGSQTITVGAGGAGATSNLTNGQDGGSSTIQGVVTAAGGGGGAGNTSAGGNNGGSGGGGLGGTLLNNSAAGYGTGGQGNNGGTGYLSNTASWRAAGGGGGAGSVGQNGAAFSGGNGGSGISSDISGSSTLYAGGGGGASGFTPGTGGSGIGGNGGTSGSPGATNTGSGGGGGNGGNGGNGGSGIVIVRYSTTSSNPMGTIMSSEIDYDWTIGANSWDKVLWTADNNDGEIKLRVYYTNSTPCDTIIPDGALPGNSTGFTPTDNVIDISGLSTTTYNTICLQATLSVEAESNPPILNEWEVTWDTPELTFHNADGVHQIAFNHMRHNSGTPTFRISTDHPGGFNRVRLDLNSEPDFGGSSHAQLFTGSYSSNTEYNLVADSLSPPLSSSNTYYARVQVSDNGGATWSPWSTLLWPYTFSGSTTPSWYQAEDAQFATGILTGSAEIEDGRIVLVGTGEPLATGGTVTDSDGSIIHTFTSNGTFTLLSGSISNAEYLVVGGGGAGGTTNATSVRMAGGGGGGRVAQGTTTISANQSITIGAGGTTSAGESSSLGSIATAAGGAVGASATTAGGSNGTAPGGGGSAGNTGQGTGGGNGGSGGSGAAGSAANYGGGGGGASDSASGVSGGQGVTSSISGTSLVYGSGGGGGYLYYPGGSGGSGAGNGAYSSVNGTGNAGSGMPNRGGGGGGGAYHSSSGGPASSRGSGGSGVVIVRYTPSITGTIMSQEIDYDWVPGATSWNQVIWSANNNGGEIRIRVYYSNTNPCDTIIPNGALSGNSAGFLPSSSPLNISGLNTTTYSKICLQATLTGSMVDSPELNNWEVTWNASGPTATPTPTPPAGNNQDINIEDLNIEGIDFSHSNAIQLAHIKVEPCHTNKALLTQFFIAIPPSQYAGRSTG